MITKLFTLILVERTIFINKDCNLPKNSTCPLIKIAYYTLTKNIPFSNSFFSVVNNFQVHIVLSTKTIFITKSSYLQGKDYFIHSTIIIQYITTHTISFIIHRIINNYLLSLILLFVAQCIIDNILHIIYWIIKIIQ